MIKMIIPEKFIFTYILIYYTTPSYNIPIQQVHNIKPTVHPL